ncbi:MAG: glycosyltransferase family 4 protein [Bryobacteraceae bacterium]
MNILCLDQYGELGGAQRMLLELLPSFTARGWNPYVAVPDGSGSFPEKLRELGLGNGSFQIGKYSKVRKTRAEMFFYLWDSYRLANQFLRWMRTLAIDFVYVNGPRVLPAASLAARRSGLPLLFHCHNRLHQRSAACLAGGSLCFARAQVIACSRYVTEPLLAFLNSEHVRVVYNGVTDVSVSSVIPGRKITRIGVIGRIEEEKGQLEFIHAARILSRTRPELRFSIIGKPLFADSAYFERVRTAAEGLPVEFPGWIDSAPEIFAALDLIVVPSTSLDATPRIVLEALAARTPIVAYAVGGIPEVLTDMETGILVRERTPEALAKGMALALEMAPEQMEHLIQNGRRTWQARHNPEAYRNNICQIMAAMVKAA